MATVSRLMFAHLQRSDRVKAARRLGMAAALLGAVACGEVADKTVVIAIGADGDALIPLMWTQTQGRAYSDLLFDKLAEIGPTLNTVGDAGYEPRLASKWTWSADSLSIVFHLNPLARWHDGKAVTAGDVRFAFDLYTDPKTASNGGRELATNIDSVSVGDSLTVTAWFKRRTPEQFHSVAYNLVPLPRHLLSAVARDSVRTSAFATHPVGSGPFTFGAWDKTHTFEVLANEAYYRGRPKLNRVVFSAIGSQAGVRAVLAGDADFFERLTLDDMAEAAKNSSVKEIGRAHV